MRRVRRPGGIVAARDSDYAAMTWFPADPRLDRWLALYHEVARANGGEPDAGRRLLAWAHAAGFGDVAAIGIGVVLRDAGRSSLVGRAVGGPGDRVGLRRRRPSSAASAIAPSWTRSRRPGGHGPRRPMAGSPSSTARSSAGLTGAARRRDRRDRSRSSPMLRR